MKRLLKFLNAHLYTFMMVLVIIGVILWTRTNGFAALRRNAGELQKNLRGTEAQLLGQVWCTTTFTGKNGQFQFGHYPGMSTEEVLTFHNGPIWLLRDPGQKQETNCFRSWRAAAEAGQLASGLSGDATEEAYKNAVLGFYLDASRQDPTPVVAGVKAADATAKGATPVETRPAEIWCFSEIKTTNNLVVTVPHPPGGRAAIETVLDGLSDRSEFKQYTIRTSVCFKTWPEAADYITGGEVWLPDSATESDYQAAIKKWQDAKR